ncbi:hypothetical protein ACCS64_38840, partial [Rhizobium ruizarguesonis]
TDRYLWITNKGWHNIKVTNGSGSGHVYFNGFIAMSFKDFYLQSQNAAVSFSPTILGYTTAGTPTYTTQNGKYTVDYKNRKIHVV